MVFRRFYAFAVIALAVLITIESAVQSTSPPSQPHRRKKAPSLRPRGRPRNPELQDSRERVRQRRCSPPAPSPAFRSQFTDEQFARLPSHKRARYSKPDDAVKIMRHGNWYRYRVASGETNEQHLGALRDVETGRHIARRLREGKAMTRDNMRKFKELQHNEKFMGRKIAKVILGARRSAGNAPTMPVDGKPHLDAQRHRSRLRALQPASPSQPLADPDQGRIVIPDEGIAMSPLFDPTEH